MCHILENLRTCGGGQFRFNIGSHEPQTVKCTTYTCETLCRGNTVYVMPRQAKLANSNELLERSILRTQQQEGNEHASPRSTKLAWCPGGCGRTVGCALSPTGRASPDASCSCQFKRNADMFPSLECSVVLNMLKVYSDMAIIILRPFTSRQLRAMSGWGLKLFAALII